MAQIHPGPVECAGGGALGVSRAPKTLRVRQQVGRKPTTLRGDIKEQGFHRWVRRVFGDVSEATLGILACLDQMVQDGTFTAISHGVSLSYSQ
jgi:hypothetical protein